jgi:small subunit ribosomal protein S8e
MGIGRDSRHKRHLTGARRKVHKKKRKYELGRPAAMTRIGNKRIRLIRTLGGNTKRRALRLDAGNFSWSTETNTHKTKILDVVYNASNNELVRTKSLVKGCIVQIDATPFKQYYTKHYGLADDFFSKSPSAAAPTFSNKITQKYQKRQKDRSLESLLRDQLVQGRLLAAISSRPGQSGRADGYILEGEELAFYKKKLRSK